MRFRALHSFTHKLPLLEPSNNFGFIGDTTETAIINGVINGVVFEIERYIKEFKLKRPSINILFTGGDALFLADKIKYPIFVDEFLVLKGLNRILNYNVTT